MREGTGEAIVAVTPEVAFAYLADPRHAPEWFAGVQFTEQPEGAPHMGMRWRFVQVRSGHRVVPVRMATFDPPSHFVWRTALLWPRTNLRWEMRIEPAINGGDGTRLRMTIGIEPGPMGSLSLWLTKPAFRPDPAIQAQRAVERARDALMERATKHAAGPSPARKPADKRAKRHR